MIISQSLKYVYVAVPKTASQSISKLLQTDFDGHPYGNYHNVVIPPECLSFYTICSVRHPYTRAISLYMYAKANKRHRCYELANTLSFEEYMVWLANPMMEPRLGATTNDANTLRSSNEIEIELLKQTVDNFMGRDLSQTDYLAYFMGINYISKLDSVIRYERLQEDIRKLPFVGETLNLPHLNKSEKNHDWRHYINRKTEQLIHRWSMYDFLNFGYERIKF